MKIQSNGFISILDIHFGKKCNNRLDNIDETIKDKFSQIFLECIERDIKAIFIAGDVFESCSIDRKTLMLAYKIFNKFKNYGIQVFTIYGNHDEYRYNKEFRHLTPLKDLVDLGVINLMSDKKIQIENNGVVEYSIKGFDYLDTDKLKEYLKEDVVKTKTRTVAIGHCFYENEFMGGKENITKEDVEDSGIDFLILGHDHSHYNVELCDTTHIIRNGSIIRDSSSKNDMQRTPSVTIFQRINGQYTVFNKELKCEELKSVISTKNIVNKEQNKIDFKEMIEAIKIDNETKEIDLISEAINNLENENVKNTIRRFVK